MEATISLERELKLDAPAGFRLPDLSGLGPGLAVSPEELRRETAVYYDTPDLRLTRWGCGLRYRSSDAWTVKLAAAEDGPALVRREFRFGGAPGRPPPAALDLVLGLTRQETLGPVARLRTVRRKREVRNAAGARLAEVTDDRVAVLEGRRVVHRFREVEVEFGGHCPPELVEEIVARLRRAGTGPAHRIAKQLRALGLESGVVEEVSIPELEPHDAAAQAVRRALARSIATLVRRDAGVRVGEDVEDLHRMRVATRRLRSHLRTFRPLLDEAWARRLQEDLRWLGAELGRVRDADVLWERFRRAARELPKMERRAVKDLLNRLAESRQVERQRMLDSLRSARYLDLLDRLVEAARSPRLQPEAGQPARVALAPLLRRRWNRLSRSVEKLAPEPAAAELHAVRIRAKHARYTAEAVAPVFGETLRRLAKALRRVQQTLGQHQDTVVASRWLRDGACELSGEAALAAGMLVAREQRIARRALRRWPSAWREAASCHELAARGAGL